MVPDATVVLPPSRVQLRPRSLAGALASPVGAARLRGRVVAGARVAIIVSDRTREEPRDAMIRAVLDEIAEEVEVTLAVANGTHPPGPLDELALPALRFASVRNHDSTASEELVEVGRTSRGTRVRFPRWLLEQDLVVATGRVRPHYFAGFGAGAKAVFPGLGAREDIRQNHLLKAEPGSRLGNLEGNPCRDDLEEGARLLAVETFLVNVVIGADGSLSAVAGDLVAAHRSLVDETRSQWMVDCARANVVITSDCLPLTGSLYQASKLLAPAGLMLASGGVAVLVAECPDGTGPLEVVNRGIYELGIRGFFPEPHIIYMVSGLPREVVDQTYCRWAPSVEWVLERYPGAVTVLPHAGNIIPRLA